MAGPELDRHVLDVARAAAELELCGDLTRIEQILTELAKGKGPASKDLLYGIQDLRESIKTWTEASKAYLQSLQPAGGTPETGGGQKPS